jgi:hypothetical protein
MVPACYGVIGADAGRGLRFRALRSGAGWVPDPPGPGPQIRSTEHEFWGRTPKPMKSILRTTRCNLMGQTALHSLGNEI